MRHYLTSLTVALAALAFAQAPTVTTLTLEEPTELVQGQSVTLRATLSDAAGAPVSGAAVTFSASIHLFDYSDVAVLGTSRTNFRGDATLSFTPTIEGRRDLFAAFEGSADMAPSAARLPVAVAAGVLPAATRPPPPVLPWLTRSRAVAVLLPAILGVWIVFGYALYQMTSIAREGRALAPARGTQTGT